ncbi:hypothetical protein J7E97_16180 [Streptomyces sp. ISL-66]|uniref:hypothetical protein n=1 Tax=Streptomyces sp. ISL-66 TaxID=2819186 RepID=UPI001BEA66EC|nr:hypothetical protein [Streptomyces sp. ISL-66]MBT2469372.1 hypothetical protein [Streptomyces sp. ISL-66]
MTHASPARRVRRPKSSTPTWHSLAEVTNQRRALWARGSDHTRWAPCGAAWDAVAVTPMSLGLDALVGLGLGTGSGYPVLADRIRGILYVLVPPGEGSAAAMVSGVRALSGGDQLLMPCTDHGTPSAHWISPPREVPPLLVPADRLAAQLQDLVADHRRAVAS